MSVFLQNLTAHQARIDAVRRVMPRSPIGKPITDLTDLHEPVTEARAALAAAQSDLAAAQVERDRCTTAQQKAAQIVADLRERALAGELVDTKRLNKEKEAIERSETELSTINSAIEYRQRMVREAANRMVDIASCVNWFLLDVKRERADLAIERRVSAELAEKNAMEQFEIAKMLLGEGFRSYSEADLHLRKFSL